MSDLNNVKIIINENENNIINDDDNHNGNNDEVDNCKYENKEQLNSSNNNENNCNNYNENDEKCDIKSENTEKNNCKTYNKKNKNNKTISVLVRQSDEIQKTYKPSIFEDVINGPRGPDVRLHRHSVVIGLLKLLLILYFTAGIILLSVVSLCITINVGYVCVQIDDTNSLIQMIFFVFYFNALYSIIYSCWKTYLRLIKTIINSNFGSSINDLFIKRILGYYVTIKIVNITMPKQYKDHPKDWYEKLNLIVFCIFMFIILLPFPIVAFIFGYWEITGIICILFVGGGALSIIGLNAFSRLILFIKLFSRLDEFYYNAPFYVDLDERAENQTSYLRLVYCTSNGLYGGCNLFDYILKLLIIMCAQISVSAFFFGSFDPSVIKVGISFGLLIIMLPILFRKKICTIFQKLSVKLHLLSENKIKVNKTKDNDKINAKMEATHNQYLNNKRNTIIMNNNRKSMNLSGTYLDFNNLNLNEGSGSLRCKTIKSKNQNNYLSLKKNIIYENNGNNSENDKNDNGNNSNDNDNNNINEKSNNNYDGLNNNDDNSINYNSIRMNSNNEIPIYNNQIDNISYQQNSLYFNNEQTESLLSMNEEESKNNFNFYNLLNSKNPYFHHKVLLTWNIGILTSWKGCLTIFILRLIKFIVGISFMAVLNYFRYSESSDSDETKQSLYIDIISHMIFVIILLLQDVVFLIPASTEIISMKTRRYFLSILLVVELILITVMRVAIINNYIPMAFILIAYANFIVHPDPRYSWDDEETERKTLFDIFNPEVDLRSEISYKHYGKTKGLFVKNSRKTFSFLYRKYSTDKSNKINERIHNSISSNSTNNNTIVNNSFNYNQYLSRFSKDNSFKCKSINKKRIKARDKLERVVKSIRKEMQYKRNTRACHNSAIILMVLSLVLILSFIVSIKFSDKGKKSSYTIEDLTDDEGELTKQKPAICQWRADGISINEFCALSYAAYYRNVEDATHSWEFGRPKSSMNNFIVDNNNLNSTTGVHYIDFINKESNVLVVAIRGTLTMEDMFQDCYIWSASALLQVSGYFGTFINFWPRETIASLVNFIVKQFTNLRLLYWIDVEKHIKELQMNTNYTLYLTGHSLGGGVAGVIASHLNIPAITFSSPGLGYSYKTYDIQLKKLIKNFVNIIPMSDPIPKLDSQVGEIQYIECKTGHPFACHRIMNTLDTLNNLCSENSVYRYWDNQVEKVIDGVPVNYELHP